MTVIRKVSMDCSDDERDPWERTEEEDLLTPPESPLGEELPSEEVTPPGETEESATADSDQVTGGNEPLTRQRTTSPPPHVHRLSPFRKMRRSLSQPPAPRVSVA